VHPGSAPAGPFPSRGGPPSEPESKSLDARQSRLDEARLGRPHYDHIGTYNPRFYSLDRQFSGEVASRLGGIPGSQATCKKCLNPRLNTPHTCGEEDTGRAPKQARRSSGSSGHRAYVEDDRHRKVYVKGSCRAQEGDTPRSLALQLLKAAGAPQRQASSILGILSIYGNN